MKKQLITLCLLASFLLAGCGNTTPATSTDTTAATGNDSVVTTAPEPEKDPLMDDLGEFDFDGYTYRVLSVKYDPAASFTLFDTQTINGELLNDTLYKRNREIEERFKIVFSASEDTYANNYKKLQNSVNSNSDEFDMIQVINRNAFSAGLAGQLADVEDMKYLNPEKDYYLKDINDQLSIAGKQFFYYTEESLHTFERPNCLVYNKDIAENYNLENFYELVRNGKWTLDKLYENAQKVSADLDGNGVYDAEDQYGFIGTADYMFASLYNGAGELTIRKGSDDIPYFAAISSDRFATIIDGILNQLNGGSHIRLHDQSKYTQTVEEFTANKSLFAATVVGRIATFREMESDYGLLPYPKFDEAQDRYYSRVIDGWLHVVPSTNPDPERTSVIMEALASGTARLFIPAYYENYISLRALRDEDSVEMLNLIKDTRIMDLGECPWYSNVRVKYSKDLLLKQTVQLASLNASIDTAVGKLIEDAVKTLNQLP